MTLIVFKFLATFGAATIFFIIVEFICWFISKLIERKEFTQNEKEDIIEEAKRRAIEELMEQENKWNNIKSFQDQCINKNK